MGLGYLDDLDVPMGRTAKIIHEPSLWFCVYRWWEITFIIGERQSWD